MAKQEEVKMESPQTHTIDSTSSQTLIPDFRSILADESESSSDSERYSSDSERLSSDSEIFTYDSETLSSDSEVSTPNPTISAIKTLVLELKEQMEILEFKSENSPKLGEPQQKAEVCNIGVRKFPKKVKRNKLLKKSSCTESHQESNLTKSSASPTDLTVLTPQCTTSSTRTGENRQLLQKQIRDLCKSRIPFLNPQNKDLKQLIKLMCNAVFLRHNYPENQVRNARCKVNPLTLPWLLICDLWDSTIAYIEDMIIETENLFLGANPKYLNSSFQQFYDYGNKLKEVVLLLKSLADLCKEGLAKYRRLCLYYEDYVFLTHVISLNELISELHQKLMLESEYFTSFDHILIDNKLVSEE